MSPHIGRMPYRVAIIGQSNSIMQTGFVMHLMRRPEIEIGHMGRIGASPSVILPFYAAPEWLAGHDVCIFDIAVMDHVFLWSDAIDLASIAQYLAYAIQMAHAAGCMPLLLIVPHRASLPHLNGGMKVHPLHQIYHAVAARYGAMMLDLTEGLDNLGRQSPVLLDEAYDDPNHPAEAVQYSVAARIVSLIEEMAATAIERRRISAAVPNFERLGLAGLSPDAPAAVHGTSLYKGRFTFINPGDRLILPTGRFDRLHGLLVNRSQSGAKLLIEGNRNVVKVIGTKNERDMPLVVQLCSVTTPVRDCDGTLALSIANPYTLVTEESCNPIDECDGRIELGEILIERGWQEIEFDAPTLPPRLSRPFWQP